MKNLVVLLTFFVFGVFSAPHSLRFFHGSIDAPSLDIYAQGRLVVQGLQFGHWSDYMLVDSNISLMVDVHIVNDYASLMMFTISSDEFMVCCPQTLILYGFYDQLMTTLIDQVCSPHGKGAWVNALNLYHGIEPVDILINSAAVCTGLTQGDRLLWTDVTYQELTDMKMISNPSQGPFNGTVSLTRIPHPVLTQFSLVVEDGHTYTIIAIGENVVDPFSMCGSRGTMATGDCPSYPIRAPAWISLPSEFTSTCQH